MFFTKIPITLQSKFQFFCRSKRHNERFVIYRLFFYHRAPCIHSSLQQCCSGAVAAAAAIKAKEDEEQRKRAAAEKAEKVPLDAIRVCVYRLFLNRFCVSSFVGFVVVRRRKRNVNERRRKNALKRLLSFSFFERKSLLNFRKRCCQTIRLLFMSNLSLFGRVCVCVCVCVCFQEEERKREDERKKEKERLDKVTMFIVVSNALYSFIDVVLTQFRLNAVLVDTGDSNRCLIMSWCALR
jgi:hypothetical protein